MGIVQLSEPTVAQLQKEVYNRNLGGSLNRSTSFSVPAGVNWAVVGCVLADAATPSGVLDTVVPGIEALAEVTSVHGDQLYGELPASLDVADHDFVLFVTSNCNYDIGVGGDTFKKVSRVTETVNLPVGKKWCVVILRVPDPLDATKVSALESAIQGVTGVTLCEHLIDDSISDRAVSDADLRIVTHVRIEPTTTP